MSSVLVGILSETRLFSDGVSRMVNADSSVQLIEADEEALGEHAHRYSNGRAVAKSAELRRGSTLRGHG